MSDPPRAGVRPQVCLLLWAGALTCPALLCFLFHMDLLSSISVSYLGQLTTAHSLVLVWWAIAVDLANAGHSKSQFYVATDDSVLTDYHPGCLLYFKCLGITLNVKNFSRPTRSKNGKQELTQREISYCSGQMTFFLSLSNYKTIHVMYSVP